MTTHSRCTEILAVKTDVKNTWLYHTIFIIYTGTHFASFKENDCGERSAVFSPNKGNDDGAHPVEVEEVTVGEVEPDSIVFIHRPNVGQVLTEPYLFTARAS